MIFLAKRSLRRLSIFILIPEDVWMCTGREKARERKRENPFAGSGHTKTHFFSSSPPNQNAGCMHTCTLSKLVKPMGPGFKPWLATWVPASCAQSLSTTPLGWPRLSISIYRLPSLTHSFQSVMVQTHLCLYHICILHWISDYLCLVICI